MSSFSSKNKKKKIKTLIQKKGKIRLADFVERIGKATDTELPYQKPIIVHSMY